MHCFSQGLGAGGRAGLRPGKRSEEGDSEAELGERDLFPSMVFTFKTRLKLDCVRKAGLESILKSKFKDDVCACYVDMTKTMQMQPVIL